MKRFSFTGNKIGLKFIAMGTLAAASVACVPQEQVMPIPSPAPSSAPAYAGFTGAISAQTINGSKIQLSWNASSDPTVVAYNIYDVTTLFGPPVLKRTVPVPATSFTLNGLTAGQLYSFRVRAATASGTEDGNNNIVSGIPYAGAISPAIIINSTTAKISFNDGSNADQVNIYCATGANPNAGDFQQLATVSMATATPPTYATLNGLVGGTTYTCRAALQISGVVDNNVNYVTFVPMGQADHLAFTTQPGGALAGTALSPQPVVTIQDANNNTVSAGPDATAPITLTISNASPSGGTVRGTATVSAVNGVATFTGLNLQEAGTKILTASKPATSGAFSSGAMSADSASFIISPGTVDPSHSTITASPAGPLVANGTASYTVSIVLADQYGNAVPGIKPQFTSTNANDALSEPTANTDATGTSTGSISTTVVGAGSRTLSISSPSGLTADTTTVSFVAGPAAKLAFVTQPANSPAGNSGMGTITVAVEDAQGNLVSTDNSTQITLSISTNPGGGTLSGTNTQTAVNGIATFSGLGIDVMANGYRLMASSSPSYTMAYSNSFNITSSGPSKIGITGSTSIQAGVCSAAYSVKLLDSSGNASNATGTMTVALTGGGNGAFYSNNSCTGGAITTLSFATGTNTKTVYFKDNYIESLTLTASVNPLSPGTLAITTNPTQIALSAPASVVAGQCSSAFTISTSAPGGAGPVWTDASVALTGSGLTGSGHFYSDASCTTLLTPTALTLLSSAHGNPTGTTSIYFKDNVSESLSFNVQDNSGYAMSTISGSQTINVLPSTLTLTFSGANPAVRSGDCSASFLITIRDAAGNAVNVTASGGKTLNLNGLGSNAGFYPAGCAGGSAYGSTITIPQGSSSATVYLKDNTSETLSLTVSDPSVTNTMATSSSITMQIWPSTISLTSAVGSNADVNLCSQFTATLKDATSTTKPALSALSVSLGGNTSGTWALNTNGVTTPLVSPARYYSDSGCTTPITSLSFSSGTSTKNYYFSSILPGNSVTLTASANLPTPANAMTQGTLSFTVNAKPGWIGNKGSTLSLGFSTGYSYSFQSGLMPMQPVSDAPSSAQSIHFDSAHRYLYIADSSAGRVLKYDYLNSQYLGWLGVYNSTYNVGFAGSTVSTSVANYCTSSISTWQQPLSYGDGSTFHGGWCMGGQSTTYRGNNNTLGGIGYPYSITDDGSNLYVLDTSNNQVLRYDAATGKFLGWIGMINSTSGVSAITCTTGTPTAGSVTPSWCYGGQNVYNQETSPYNMNNISASGGVQPNYWDGAFTFQQVNGNWGGYGAVAYGVDQTGNPYLYIAAMGGVYRYRSDTGTYQGWIGNVYSTTGMGSCTIAGTPTAGQPTLGWCKGGTMTTSGTASGTMPRPSAVYVDATNNALFVADASRDVILTYNMTTGQYIGTLSLNLSKNQVPWQITGDGAGNFWVATTTAIYELQLEDASGNPLGSSATLGRFVGKVSAQPTSCYNGHPELLNPGDNTASWCSGGAYGIPGQDETSFAYVTGLAYDAAAGSPALLSGDGVYPNSSGFYGLPNIRKWDVVSGTYQGSLIQSSSSTTLWQNDKTSIAPGLGYDDNSMTQPAGIFVDSTKQLMYVVETLGSVIKQFDLRTGSILGVLGMAVTKPTGGQSGCTSVTPYSFTNLWCLGAMYAQMQFIDKNISVTTGGGIGATHSLQGIAVDTTNNYIFVTDRYNHRLEKYSLTTGAFIGWVGYVSNNTGSQGCTNDNSTYNLVMPSSGTTPGWCKGGSSNSGSGDGQWFQPLDAYYYNGYVYVIDSWNNRVQRIDAVTGIPKGWIGYVNSATGLAQASGNSAGCGSSGTSNPGWCTGGTSTYSGSGWPGGTAPIAGGFSFGAYNWFGGTGGITGDGTYLYVSNSIANRIDKIQMSSGAYVASVYTNGVNFPATNLWTTSLTTSTQSYNYPQSVWTDGASLYATYVYGSGGPTAVYKWNLSTGAWLGYKGGYASSPAPAVSSGWYNGGALMSSLKLFQDSPGVGGFGTARGLSGDANYIYVTDTTQGRIQRIPK